MKYEATSMQHAPRWLSLVLCLCVLVLVGCGQGQQAGVAGSPAPSPAVQAAGSPAPSPAVQEAATPAPSPAQVAEATPAPSPTTGPTATPTLGPDEFRNPVIDRDFPDPDTLKVDDTYYAYATNSGGSNVQIARSTDLVTWERLPDVLPVLPLWAAGGFTWAPEVTSWNDGETFTMYFTARHAESGRQCIGVATSDTPDGVFEPVDEPFICQLESGGSIDAAAFEDDDGTQYVLWKNDGNCCGYAVHIYIQEVSDDGLTLQGEPTELITNDQLWEGGLVEAPTLWKQDDRYYLFYSANSFAGLNYATGYAVAEEPTGPYTKPGDEPFIASDLETGAAFGPGGQDIVVDDEGDTWMVYHSWDQNLTYRRMMIDELVWEGDTPVLQGPDRVPQPKP